jgi:hypothetical protein
MYSEQYVFVGRRMKRCLLRRSKKVIVYGTSCGAGANPAAPMMLKGYPTANSLPDCSGNLSIVRKTCFRRQDLASGQAKGNMLQCSINSMK